jgi:diadenylate cyclase
MEMLTSAVQWVIDYLRFVEITAILDIAIIAFVIYKLLIVLRSTSSGNVMKGVILVIAAVVLARVLDLYTVTFILNRVVEWGVLALVILFQPELRRFLERMGNSKLSKMFTAEETPEEMENAIRQTVTAYTSLSKDKTGALIVFERKNRLDDEIKTGTALDCAVSSELLKNIFWNKAPLHDGAVIVRSGRIVGAGCMLPMSGNVNLSRDLGMRHRAGIGISEHSDAVVAIVSEETGSISVAVDGMLKRHLAPETLERLLRNELLTEEGQEENLGGKNPLTGLFRPRKGEDDHGQAEGK